MLISDFIENTKNLKGSTPIKMAYKKCDVDSDTDKNSYYVEYYKDPCYHGVVEINEKSPDPIATLDDIRTGSFENGDKFVSEAHVSPHGFLSGNGSIIFY